MHAEEILDLYPNLPRKRRETAILQRYPAIFIIGIGWMLKDVYPHKLRAADYDDWITPTHPKNGHLMHGLNGDILVWPVRWRRHELSSMGIRVNAESLKKQLELTHQLDFLKYPYHQAIVKHEIPLSIWRRNRAVTHADASVAQGAPRRTERDSMAEGAEGDV